MEALCHRLRYESSTDRQEIMKERMRYEHRELQVLGVCVADLIADSPFLESC